MDAVWPALLSAMPRAWTGRGWSCSGRAGTISMRCNGAALPIAGKGAANRDAPGGLHSHEGFEGMGRQGFRPVMSFNTECRHHCRNHTLIVRVRGCKPTKPGVTGVSGWSGLAGRRQTGRLQRNCGRALPRGVLGQSWEFHPLPTTMRTDQPASPRCGKVLRKAPIAGGRW